MTAVPFWGTDHLELEWFVPKTGLQFAKRGLDGNNGIVLQ